MNLIRYAGYFMPATPLQFKILKYGYYVVVFCAQSQAKFLQQKWVVEATEIKELSGIRGLVRKYIPRVREEVQNDGRRGE